MNQQQQEEFKKKAIDAGYSEQQINQYLNPQSTPPQPIAQQPGKLVMHSQPKRDTASGFLGFMGPSLASIPQALGSNIGWRRAAKTGKEMQQLTALAGDRVVDIAQRLRTETDPVKIQQLQKALQLARESEKETGMATSDIAGGEWIQEATSIDLGMLGRYPGLEEGRGGLEQIAGRSVRQVGVGAAGMLGLAGTGALFGAGTAIERGEDAVGVAKESAKMAIIFKSAGWGLGKAINTPLGQRVLQSPVGSTLLNTTQKIVSPFVAKPAAAGTIGASVDQAARNIGSMIDRVFAPTTYTKPVGGILRSVGEKTGVLPDRVESSQKKLESYWDGVKNRYTSLVKHDANSPKFLSNEGIIPEVKKGTIHTMDQSRLVGQKANAEHRMLNSILEKSGGRVNINDMRTQIMNDISTKFKGLEKQQAIQHFEKQFNALLSDFKISGTEMPLHIANDIKSYMWGQGYPKGMVSVSDAINARTMRVAGRTIKDTIATSSNNLDPAIHNSITQLNQHTSDLLQAQKFLESVHGKKAAFGRLGSYFTRLYMTMIGSAAGPVGGAVGFLGADAVTSIMQNPAIKLGKAAQIIAAANKQTPGVLGEALKVLNGINR